MLPLAVVQPFDNRRPPRYLCRFIRKPLRQVRMILLNYVEHGLLGEQAMIIGKQLVQVCEFFIVHGNAPFV
jgi:hypothetical protein